MNPSDRLGRHWTATDNGEDQKSLICIFGPAQQEVIDGAIGTILGTGNVNGGARWTTPDGLIKTRKGLD